MSDFSEKLPDPARAALRRPGRRLLDRLENLRAEGVRIEEVRPLDRQAQIALSGRGDALLARLAARRRKTPSGRGRWLRAAAIVVGMAGIALAMRPDAAPRVAAAQAASVPALNGAETVVTPVVPEPSSTMLLLIGGMWMVLRRRRGRG